MFNENFSHGKKFDVEIDNFPFTTLDQVIKENGNKVLKVQGVFAYQAKLGVRPVLIAEGLKIHLPSHCLKDVEKILSNDEYCAAINAGHCGFKTSQYVDKNGITRNSGTFIDI